MVWPVTSVACCLISDLFPSLSLLGIDDKPRILLQVYINGKGRIMKIYAIKYVNSFQFMLSIHANRWNRYASY